MFDFKKAQKSELDWQAAYIRDHLEPDYRRWLVTKKLPIYNLTSWFDGDHVPFMEHIIGGIGIEIGCGSIPAFRDSHELARRIVIDPLAGEYKRIQTELWGGSFFDDVEIIAKPVEEYQDSLFGAADVIVYRNSLDHTEDPLRAIEVMTSYANKGCYLLFWTDIWHNFPTDDGHRNITRSEHMMNVIMEAMGWDYQFSIPSQHEAQEEHIEYGGVWIKL